jgi:branched-subunit amino acid aminotransferase/4-amino-4-deoxychorismate lyase
VFARIDGVWCTPPLDVGILSGITRRTVLELCARAHLPAAERVLWPQDLLGAAEIFLCASVREIVPIVQLDGKPVGHGKVGEATRAMLALYRAEVQARGKVVN